MKVSQRLVEKAREKGEVFSRRIMAGQSTRYYRALPDGRVEIGKVRHEWSPTYHNTLIYHPKAISLQGMTLEELEKLADKQADEVCYLQEKLACTEGEEREEIADRVSKAVEELEEICAEKVERYFQKTKGKGG